MSAALPREDRLATTWRGDLAGGVTSAIVALPQTITIGVLAFTPLGPGYTSLGILAGFYCSIISGLIVALGGSTRFQVGGPRSSFSLVMALMITILMAQYGYATGTTISSAAVVTAILATVFLAVALAGLVQLLFGVFGFGSYIKFIPSPVVAGFTNGIAFLILASQLPYLLGLQHGMAWTQIVAGGWKAVQPWTFVVAVVTIATILAANRWLPKLPGALVGVAVGTATYYLILHLVPSAALSAPIGTIPATLPKPEWFAAFWHLEWGRNLGETLLALAPSILVLAVLGALESLMCAVTVGQLSGQRPDANRELTAQGLSNIVGAGFGAVFGGSTTSRTVLNFKSGGRSRLSGSTHALFMFFALLTANWWVAYLPHVVLAGVLAYIGSTMFDEWTRNNVKRLFRRASVSAAQREVRANLAIVLLVTVATILFNLVVGVTVGLLASFVLFVGKSSKSIIRHVHFGDRRHSLRLRNAEQTLFLRECGKQIAVVELEGAVFFGTADQLAQDIEMMAASSTYVILDFRRVNEIDATGAHILNHIGSTLAKRGKQLAFSTLIPEEPHGEFLTDMGVTTSVHPRFWFRDVDTALEWAEDRMLAIAFPDEDTRGELPIAQMVLSHGFTTMEIVRLAGFLVRQTFDRGETLFRQGDAGDKLFVIAQGLITIRLPQTATRAEKRLVTCSPGVMFGEMVLLEDRPRSADAVADEYTVVYSLSRDDVTRLQVQDPVIAGKLLLNISRLLADRLRTTTEAPSRFQKGAFLTIPRPCSRPQELRYWKTRRNRAN
jgi:sulfate permease, SulP family